MPDLLSAAIATNRFGLGARPGELAGVAGDPRGWLRAQLRGSAVARPSTELPGSADILRRSMELRQDRAEAKREAAAVAIRLGAYLRPVYIREVEARFEAGLGASQPWLERLTQFWSNHFAVSADKLAVLGLAGAFEREAIRPHVTGRFVDLLRAAVRHPAMLLYLDNHLSIGPNSRLAQLAARRGKREREIGINENLAREILELHTLGVDGGYSQADVTAFAGVISGWSVGGLGPAAGARGPLAAISDEGKGSSGEFVFREWFHEPGAKSMLGRAYRQDGAGQGEAVLADLARSPHTARHIADKLARHFIADEPPASVVTRLSDAYLRSDGDLTAVYRALLDSDAAWQAGPGKYKTPSDYVLSTYRALQLPAESGRRAVLTFDALGQRPFAPGSPAGWPDRAADWDGSSALLKRLEWVDVLAQRVGSACDAATLGPAVLGDALGAATRATVSRAASGTQALTLLLASPEFLRR